LAVPPPIVLEIAVAVVEFTVVATSARVAPPEPVWALFRVCKRAEVEDTLAPSSIVPEALVD
jgi:hypothetical protein